MAIAHNESTTNLLLGFGRHTISPKLDGNTCILLAVVMLEI